MDLIQEQKKILTAYTKTFNELNSLKAENNEVFSKADELQVKMDEQAGLIKKLASDSEVGVENKSFKVVATRAFKRWFNFTTMKGMLDESQQALVMEEVVKDIRIDSPEQTKKLQELAKDGKIPMEAIQKSFVEDKLTTRVSIKPLK